MIKSQVLTFIECLLSAGTVLDTLQILTHSILERALWEKYCIYRPYPDRESAAQWDYITWTWLQQLVNGRGGTGSQKYGSRIYS